MVQIGKPFITQNKDKNRLNCAITLPEHDPFTVYVEVDSEYGQYLCDERADGFLVFILPYAMRNGQDICVDAPITGELFYKLSEYLIPSLADNSTVLYKSKITCPLATAVENAGAVGTGLSCGVDSFYCVCKQLGSEVGSLRLTHLCLFYYLPHNAHFDRMIGELEYGRAKKVAGELGLPLLYCDSNCQEIFDYPDFVNSYHTYYSSFVILCLQKLFGAYFYASDGHTFSNFDIRNTAFEMEPSSQTDCGCYDLLALQAFSTDRLHFYSGGGALTRTEKTRFISEFPIVQRNLFVCNDQGTNCSVCEKCKRTMLDLSAMGRLANFKSVFNVGYFESHKEEYYAWLFCRHCKNEAYIEEPWKMYKDEPLMQEVIRKDTFWKNFSYMRGIYDDKWTRKGLFTKVLRPKGTEKMTVELYFPENMGDNGVKILLNGKNSAQSDNYTSVEGGGLFSLQIPLMKTVGTDSEFSMDILLSKATCPNEKGLGPDLRELGCVFHAITFK